MNKINSIRPRSEKEVVASAREYAKKKGLRDPYKAYSNQRSGAGSRGIPWGFAFSGWWEIWEPYYHMRGVGKNGLCMARECDEGGYDADNVYITTNLGNLRDYHHKSERASEVRRIKKEKREVAFARAGSASKASRGELSSHLAYLANNTSKSTCNYRDHLTQWELSLL